MQAQQEFYSSTLFRQLHQRMLSLAAEPTQQFKHYAIHLQRVGINLHSYLLPNSDDVFGRTIKDENISTDRTTAQLDLIVLRLVQAQDREWDKGKCDNVIKSKLNEIAAAAWHYDFKGGVAWVECREKQTAEDLINRLSAKNITARLRTPQGKQSSLVHIAEAYHQIKFELTNTPAEVVINVNQPK